MRVAALFVRADSVYRTLGADCYDQKRDARSFDLACPVVAHPPCGPWGKLAHFSNSRHERDLAWWALHVVRQCGGALEHPMTSRLWDEARIYPGCRDAFGGILVPIDQKDWGHEAEKRTGIYVVRSTFRPRIGFCNPLRTVESMCKAQREHTPFELAAELVETARLAA